MSRVIFVGLHNKPHKRPLDPSTKTGKLISRIVEQLKGVEVLRTNLYDVDYFPQRDEAPMLAMGWRERVETTAQDRIVLLGQHVHNHFPVEGVAGRIIKVAHPASKRGHQEMDEYVQRTVGCITKAVGAAG